MKNHTGRIYEILRIFKDIPNEVMREILHKSWPVNFQITKLSEQDYEKFKGNVLRLLHEYNYLDSSNGNDNHLRL